MGILFGLAEAKRETNARVTLCPANIIGVKRLLACSLPRKINTFKGTIKKCKIVICPPFSHHIALRFPSTAYNPH